MSFATTLAGRAVLQLKGSDTHTLLQSILTQDIHKLDHAPAMFSVLLSAQGKFQHDMFVVDYPGGVLIETEAERCDALLKKLKMYRLRSKVDLMDMSAQFHVIAVWGKGLAEVIWPAEAISYLDPRLPTLGYRALIPRGVSFQSPGMEVVDGDAYEQHRLQQGVPDGSRDAGERHVLMELNYDQLAAVSFNKGCYVGQETTARMHYKEILRKCLHMVQGVPGTLPPVGTPIVAGEVELGEMRSSNGGYGLAMLRIAETAAAQAAGTPIVAGGAPLQVQMPPYMAEKIARLQEADAAEE